MDILEITGLRVDTKIGVHEWEQRINQRLLIDISINCDLSKCTEALESTLDYDNLCKTITNYVQTHSFNLIETVANQLAELIKTEFNIATIKLCVSKPHAIKNASNIKVCVTR